MNYQEELPDSQMPNPQIEHCLNLISRIESEDCSKNTMKFLKQEYIELEYDEQVSFIEKIVMELKKKHIENIEKLRCVLKELNWKITYKNIKDQQPVCDALWKIICSNITNTEFIEIMDIFFTNSIVSTNILTRLPHLLNKCTSTTVGDDICQQLKGEYIQPYVLEADIKNYGETVLIFDNYFLFFKIENFIDIIKDRKDKKSQDLLSYLEKMKEYNGENSNSLK